MDQEKIKNVLEDKVFAEKIVKLQTPKEVQATFKEKGIEISLEEIQLLGSIINKMVEKGSTELSEEDLESASGGLKIGDLKESAESFRDGIIFPASLAKDLVTGKVNRASSAGALVSIVGIVVATHTIVPWAYKKIKGTIK